MIKLVSSLKLVVIQTVASIFQCSGAYLGLVCMLFVPSVVSILSPSPEEMPWYKESDKSPAVRKLKAGKHRKSIRY